MASKIAQEMEAYFTNRYVPGRIPYTTYTMDTLTPEEPYLKRYTEYRFEAKFGMKQIVEPEGVEYALDRIKAAVNDAVYGDIRRLIMELDMHLRQSRAHVLNETDEVREIMDKLYDATSDK